MKPSVYAPLAAMLLFSFSGEIVWAQKPVEVEPINPRADHIERWNWFARAVYALHARRVAAHEVRTTERIGGYARQPGFYKEVTYVDELTGHMISRVQWERANPERLHSIEVFIRDASGRVIRDYGTWFLTHSRSAPQATVINLFAYNDGLVAYRQFDATDDRIYESCKGTYDDKPVKIELWDTDIIRLVGEPDTIMTTPEYAACFRGLPVKSAGRYLTPQ
jgi:hypothetical protein